MKKLQTGHVSWALLGIVIGLVYLLCVWTILIVKVVKFDVSCGGYLKRAANANSIGLAKKQLGTALSYIETNNLTCGYTSILYKSPDEDLGFWYTNLKQAYSSLDDTRQYTQLEESNVLMKLRETICDGQNITIPQGISRFPGNAGWAFANISWVLVLTGMCFCLIACLDNY